MSTKTMLRPTPYDRKNTKLLSFHEARQTFLDGKDTPRAYLERCIETIETYEPHVKAFVCVNYEGARKAADASAERYKAGRSLSLVDGMPIGVKDIYETKDMPMEVNSPIYKGWQSIRDAAYVDSLRRGGGLMVGKVVTAEFGVQKLGPTRNPFDWERTPGGSSSGSAAAVGARMVPVALGSQARGSINRPASFCGQFGFKPSFGTIHTGGFAHCSESLQHLGVHAGCLEDAWTACHHGSRSHWGGPHPGFRAMLGPATLPAAQRPSRLVRLYTLGWERTDEATKETFETFLHWLAGTGVEILEAKDDPRIAALEAELKRVEEFLLPIFRFELRWPFSTFKRDYPGVLSDILRGTLDLGEEMTTDDYHAALDRRDRYRALYAPLRGFADAFVSLNATGPAPKGDIVTDPVYGDVSALAQAPSFNLPFLSVDGMPLGVQLMGYFGHDDEAAAYANWMTQTVRSSDA